MSHSTASRVVAGALAVLLLGGCQSLPQRGNASLSTPTAAPKRSEAFSGDERTRELYLAVIGELITHNKAYAALAHLDEYERVHGPSDASHKLRGDAWLATGAVANAQKEYAVITEGRFAGYGRHGLGRVAAAGADWSVAATHFELAVREQPTNTEFLRDLGSALAQLGLFDDAAFHLRKALELSPMDPVATEALKGVLAAQERRVSLLVPTSEAPP